MLVKHLLVKFIRKYALVKHVLVRVCVNETFFSETCVSEIGICGTIWDEEEVKEGTKHNFNVDIRIYVNRFAQAIILCFPFIENSSWFMILIIEWVFDIKYNKNRHFIAPCWLVQWVFLF